MAVRHQRTIIVLAVFFGTWLLGSVYAFASPVGTSPDEPDHWRYAYAIHSGQDASDGWLEVPTSLAGFPADCVAQRRELPASCVARLTENREIVGAPTALVGAPTLYYWLVGWPLAQWPDERGVLLARVLAALVNASLWAMAILPWVGGRHWLVRLAAILTAAPAAIYFSGTVQPSGMEIAAFAALWSLSVVVFNGLRTADYHTLPPWIQLLWPLLLIVSISIRTASAWFVGVLLLVAWLWSGASTARLLRDRRLLAAGALVAGAAALRILSLLNDRGADVLGIDAPTAAPGVTLVNRVMSAASRVVNDPDRAIGLMGWIDTQVPSMGTMVWFLMAGGIAFLAAPHIRPRHLIALGVLFAVLGATWLALDVSVTTTTVAFWQARYGFPIWMGVPVLLASAYAAGTIVANAAFVPALRVGCAVGLVIMHVIAVAFLLVRYMYGTDWHGPSGTPGWQPYASLTLLVASAVAGAALVSLAVLLPGQAGPTKSDSRMVEGVTPD